MGLKNLQRAIRDEPPAPCDNCRHTVMCLMNRLACSEFKKYVGDSTDYMTSRKPSRKVYNDIYPDFVGYSEERHGA